MDHHWCWYNYLDGTWITYEEDFSAPLSRCPEQNHNDHYTGHDIKD